MWLRQVVVPNYNDTKESVEQLKEFAKTLKNVDKIELLPYHTMAVKKYQQLGIVYRLQGVADMDKETLEKWYDETYQMCLLAFLELDNLERKEKVEHLKQALN